MFTSKKDVEELITKIYEIIFLVSQSSEQLCDTTRNNKNEDAAKRLQTQHLLNASKIIQENSLLLRSASVERSKALTYFSDRLEVECLLNRLDFAYIIALNRFRIFCEQVSYNLPKVIDQGLGRKDIQGTFAAIDAVGKLVRSGPFTHYYLSSTTGSYSSVNVHKRLPIQDSLFPLFVSYTTMLQPTSTMSLSKLLSGYADTRAQYSANEILILLNQISKNADMSTIQRYQERTDNLIQHEASLMKVLIESFADSTGYIEALSKKSVRRSLSIDALAEEDVVKDETSENKLGVKPNKSKGVIWVDKVDEGVCDHLESVYLEWFLSKLKSAILGRTLFYLENERSAPWLLQWEQLLDTSDALVDALNSCSLPGPSKDILALVTSSFVLRSNELRLNGLVDKLQAASVGTSELLDKPDQDSGISSTNGLLFFEAISIIASPLDIDILHLPDETLTQLFKSTVSSLRIASECLLSYAVFNVTNSLARKNYKKFALLLFEVQVGQQRFSYAYLFLLYFLDKFPWVL